MVSAAGYKPGTQVTPKLLFTSLNVGASGKVLMLTPALIGAAIEKDHARPRAGADPPNHFKLLAKTGDPADWLWRDDMPNLQAIVTRGSQLNSFITDCCKTADYQTALQPPVSVAPQGQPDQVTALAEALRAKDSGENLEGGAAPTISNEEYSARIAKARGRAPDIFPEDALSLPGIRMVSRAKHALKGRRLLSFRELTLEKVSVQIVGRRLYDPKDPTANTVYHMRLAYVMLLKADYVGALDMSSEGFEDYNLGGGQYLAEKEATCTPARHHRPFFALLP